MKKKIYENIIGGKRDLYFDKELTEWEINDSNFLICNSNYFADDYEFVISKVNKKFFWKSGFNLFNKIDQFEIANYKHNLSVFAKELLTEIGVDYNDKIGDSCYILKLTFLVL